MAKIKIKTYVVSIEVEASNYFEGMQEAFTDLELAGRIYDAVKLLTNSRTALDPTTVTVKKI